MKAITMDVHMSAILMMQQWERNSAFSGMSRLNVEHLERHS